MKRASPSFTSTCTAKFFAAIAAGTKKTEFRARTPYWQRRLEGRYYDVIQFRNGYATRAPVMLVEFRGLRRQGRRQLLKARARAFSNAFRRRALRLDRWH